MSKLIIDLLSDTHSRHIDFTCKGGDILIHSGDVSSRGDAQEIENFIEWFADQPYKHKIFIPGNHDWSLESNFSYWLDRCQKLGIFLLNDTSVLIKSMDDPDLNLKIHGSPVQPWFHSWAFNRMRTKEEATDEHPWIKHHWDLIPEDTEILITHGPPHKILDGVKRGREPHDPYHSTKSNVLHVGCEELAKKINESNILLHVFGHIHEGRGFEYDGLKTYVNASSLDRTYCPADKKPMRVIREKFEDGSISYVL